LSAGGDLSGSVRCGPIRPGRRTAGGGCPHMARLDPGRLLVGAVVGEDLEFFDVVVGLAGHDGMNAAGVVADHAAEGAAVVRGGIGREGEMVLFGGGAKSVEHDSGLDAGDTAGGIDFEKSSPCIWKNPE